MTKIPSGYPNWIYKLFLSDPFTSLRLILKYIEEDIGVDVSNFTSSKGVISKINTNDLSKANSIIIL